jgi:transposase
MQIVGALDVHRRQITFKTLQPASGEGSRGRISPAAREPLRQWLERFDGLQGEFVLEGTTGWRFVVEEIERAGHVARLADPAETAARRGRKRRATTPTAICSCGCCSRASCPRRGSRPYRSSSCAPASGCARR